MSATLMIQTFIRQRIQSSYSTGAFDAVSPCNPREYQELAQSQTPIWLVLFIATVLSQNWSVALLSFSAFAMSVAALTLVGTTTIELPVHGQASEWQLRNYGFSFRSGVWRPIAKAVSIGLAAPYACLAGLVIWAIATKFF